MTFNEDPLFAELSPKRRKIAVTYERIRFQPQANRDTVTRRVAKELGYKINRNGTCTFVAETIRLHIRRKSNPRLG